MSLVAAIASSIAFVMGIVQISMKPPVPKTGEFIACMVGFGCTYCGELQETDCGINLRKCVDTREYRCMHDMSWRRVQE